MYNVLYNTYMVLAEYFPFEKGLLFFENQSIFFSRLAHRRKTLCAYNFSAMRIKEKLYTQSGN